MQKWILLPSLSKFKKLDQHGNFITLNPFPLLHFSVLTTLYFKEDDFYKNIEAKIWQILHVF